MIIKNRKAILLSILFISSFAAVSSAQTMRYVSYFPIPHGYHGSLSSGTAAGNVTILGGRAHQQPIISAALPANSPLLINQVAIGSAGNPAGLTVAGDVRVQNLTISSAGGSSTTLPNMYIGRLQAVASTATTSGSMNVRNSYTSNFVPASPDYIKRIQALNNLEIDGIHWIHSSSSSTPKNLNGGTGLTGRPSTSSCTCIRWEYLRLSGTDTYRQYLMCGKSSGECN